MPLSAYHSSHSSNTLQRLPEDDVLTTCSSTKTNISSFSDPHSLPRECRPFFKDKAIFEGSRAQLDDAEMQKLRTALDRLDIDDQQHIKESVDHLMATLRSSPKVLELVLKTINSNLLVMLVAEQQAKAIDLNGREKLNQGLSEFSETSSSMDSISTLEQLMVRPVITGHPTSLNKPEAIRSALKRVESIHTSPLDIQQLCDEVWAGQGHREHKPTVQQEAAHFEPIVRELLSSSHKIHKVLHQSTQALGLSTPQKNPFELGNWVAGDRDGNPTICAKDLSNVVSQYSQAAFDFYLKKLEGHVKDGKHMTPSSLKTLLTAAGQGKQLAQLIEKLRNTNRRLNQPEIFNPHQSYFNTGEEFQAALNEFDLSTLDIEDQTRADSKLMRLSQDVKTMGFFGTTTDIRQNSAMNEKTVAEVLKQNGLHPNYLGLPEDVRCKVLLSALDESTSLDTPLNPALGHADFQSEIELIQAYKQIQNKYGEGALKNCITANSETASDMLEVMLLLKVAGLVDARGLHMNVMPLIETVDDLNCAEPMLKQVLNIPWYTERLPLADPNNPQSRRVQHVMVGYSDSNRLDGPLASSWAVHKAVASMTSLVKEHGQLLQVFHGRGGTEARGSGHSYGQDIEYLNGESLAMGLRQTEQGEEVPLKFGNRELSKANLMDMLGSTLSAASKGRDHGVEKHQVLMEQLARTANEHYKSLYQHPKLAEFFRNTTPIQYMGLSNAGSRPASRKVAKNDEEYLHQMRAIPWTAAWYQSGSMMPAYYGTGTALAQHVRLNKWDGSLDNEKLQELKTMYKEWPFFKNLVDRTDMALHKSDVHMAREYAGLDPSTLPVFKLIESEHALASTMIGLIKGTESSPAEVQVKRAVEDRAIFRRWAQHIQVGLLKQLSEPSLIADLEPLKPLLVMSMQANANGVGRFG